MFRTQFERVRVFTKRGKRMKDTYSAVVNDNGSIDLVKDGVEDTYAYIQSFKDSVDLNLIMQRYANGDTSVLNKSPGMYGDFTQFPKTYAEALQAMINAENQFMALPLATREKFGCDVHKYIASIGTKEWMDALGIVPADTPSADTPSADTPPADPNSGGEE